MKASEVLRRYATGERDFRRINLRGQSFKGRDLSGADFSEADIRGTTFRHANLRGANFTNIKAGLEHQSVLSLLGFSLLIFGLLGFAYVAVGAYANVYITGITVALLSVTFAIAATRHGLEIALGINSALAAIVISLVVVVAVFEVSIGHWTLNLALKLASDITLAAAGALTSILVWIVAGAIALAGTTALNVSRDLTEKLTTSFAVIGVLVGAGVGNVAISQAGGDNVAAVWAACGITIAALLYKYVSHQSLLGDKRFGLIHRMAIAFAAMGGTSFRDAALTEANFTNAIVRNTDFRQAIVIKVCWFEAKWLDLARLGNSILSNPAVCELLVTRNGYKKSYVDANLRGADLNGVNLNGSNLKWADLSEATLRYADLRDADLSETLILGADFTGASLTGACLEGWNIDHTTNLEGVDCQYVYLLRNQQERRPSSGDFAPGEFTKLFQEVLSTVDLIFRNGVDWRAFVAAFQQVQVENEDTPLEIQSIENKGDGVVVVRVSVPTDTNKEKIHSEFNQQYEFALKALEARYQAELQAKDGEISRYREDSANMWEVIKLQAKKPIHVQAIAEAKTMNNSNDSSQTVNIGGNVTGSTINLGAISGAVTNTINQLPETPNPDQLDLKQLLIQLKEAIEADPDLPDTDKADLLEQVQNLAEAKQTEEPAQKEGLARRAKKMFEATLKSLPDTAKIVEASSKLLPLILKALGFPV
jgi:uncharacterized protein YjbI with pentapeptide repeats